jgi:hypothetical protein
LTGQPRARAWNERSFRRLIVDMHIGDWNPAFLARYDAERIRDDCLAAGSDGVMLYVQTHTGLCYWPTASGRQHACCRGRDLVRDTLEAFHAREVPVCAYYSVNFNNWAWLEHPDWRLQPACKRNASILFAQRYGVVCLNHPAYRAFLREQVAEITRYDFDAYFFDMIWWGGVCVCEHCLERCRRETGQELPRTVDWLDPGWCRFQRARERWLSELAAELRDEVRRRRPGRQVYHNFALALADWTRAVSFDSAQYHDFLGGDFYGGRDEQLVVSRLMLNLSERRPVEFMTTISANLIEYERQRETAELEQMAGAAASCSSAYLLIAPVNPDGTLQRPALERARSAFEVLAPYQPWFGGEPVEDVAVYLSDDSKMNFADNGRPLEELPAGSTPTYPHGHAVLGACRVLQQAHLPFGVITRRQLEQLGRYRVVVLPNVLRMDAEEAAALREYVRAGGCLYASRMTSLTETAGRRHADFMLADVFGCHYAAPEAGAVVFLRPTTAELGEAVRPDELVTHRATATQTTGAVRIAADADSTVLATLTLPYGYPQVGSVEDQDWAAIHVMAAWERTDHPVVVEHRFGAGRVIYSAADLESGGSPGQDRLFLALLRRLITEAPSFEARAHPSVWMTVFDQRDARRQLVSLLSYQAELPPLPVPEVEFRLRPPDGYRYTRLLRLPDEQPVAATVDADGVLGTRITGLDGFAAYLAEYEEQAAQKSCTR